MGDTHSKNTESIEKKLDTKEAIFEEQQPEKEEVKEAKISVGIEAGEIIEGAEGMVSGEISEKEKKVSEKTKTTYKRSQDKGKAAKIADSIPELPSDNLMRSQVKKELKSEIRTLRKKIKKVMRMPSSQFEANEMNSLYKQLRKLKELLSSLAQATSDMVKNLWMKYVKNKHSS